MKTNTLITTRPGQPDLSTSRNLAAVVPMFVQALASLIVSVVRMPRSLSLLLSFLGCAGIAVGSEIHDAARDGDVVKVQALLAQDPSLVHLSEKSYGYTPLHEAAARGHVAVVSLLLSNKADINAKTKMGSSPLKLARGFRKTEVATLLEQHGGACLEPSANPVASLSAARAYWAPPPVARLPGFFYHLGSGRNTLRIRNPNDYDATVGLRAGSRGVDIVVPANRSASVQLLDGQFLVYFLFSDRPYGLFQGNNISLYGHTAEMRLEGVVNGNYGIHQMR